MEAGAGVLRMAGGTRAATTARLIVANMDTVGTFTMAAELAKFGCIVAIHKHYTVAEWKEFVAMNPTVAPNVCASAGTSAGEPARAVARRASKFMGVV